MTKESQFENSAGADRPGPRRWNCWGILRIALVLGFLPWGIRSLPAAASAEVPSAPLVQPLPGKMQLEMNIVREKTPKEEAGDPSALSGGADAKGPETIESITILRYEDVRKVILKTNQGKAKVQWIIGNIIYTPATGGRGFFPGSYNPSLPGYLRTGGTSIYGVEWVSAENYKGEAAFQGVDCYYFETNEAEALPVAWQPAQLPVAAGPANPGAQAGKSALSARRAWIHKETRLPVAAQVSEGLCTYTFKNPPEGPLNPPAEYLEYERELRASIARQQEEASVR